MARGQHYQAQHSLVQKFLGLVPRSRSVSMARVRGRHVVGGVCAVAVLGAFFPLATAGASATITLGITSSKPTYALGEKVHLSLTLTNIGTTACEVSTITDGTVTVSTLTHDATPVTPVITGIDYDNPLSDQLLGSLTTLGSGGSVTINWSSAFDSAVGGQALQTVVWSADDKDQGSVFSLNASGAYSLSASYAFPPVPGAPADICPAPATSATVAFGVTTALAPIEQAVVPAGSADGITVRGGFRFQAAVAVCFAKFAFRRDPYGIIGRLLGATNTIVITQLGPGKTANEAVPDVWDRGRSARDGGTGTGTGGTVEWSPDLLGRLEAGPPPVDRDPCASLYHELFHAFEFNFGILDLRPFGGAGTPIIAEVNAVRAENSYRKAAGLPLRTRYGNPLPRTTGNAAPTCAVTKFQRVPPRMIEITVQDNDVVVPLVPDGLDTIIAFPLNATVTVPAVARGTTDPLVVRATKTKSLATVALRLTDVDGNVTHCEFDFRPS